jgi:hypothetical protein
VVIFVFPLSSDDVVAEMFHQSDKQTFGLDRSSESERTMQLQFQSAEREDTSLRYDYLPDRPESQTATEGHISESYIQNESGCHLSRNVTWDARQDLSSSEQQSSSTDTSLIGDDVRLAILDNRLPSSYGPFKGLYQEIPAFF